MYALTQIMTVVMIAVVEAMTQLTMVMIAIQMVFVMQGIPIAMAITTTIILKFNVVVMQTILIAFRQTAMETESVIY